MAAGVYNMLIEQGSTFRLRLTLKSGTTSYDLTHHIARMHIRRKIDSTDVLFALTTENGGLSIDGANGRIDLFISDDDTALFTFRNAVYDLEIENTDTGDVQRVLQGGVSISFEVTR